MILSRQLFSNSTLHQTRKRRQDIDRRVDLSVVELSINEDLSLRDITSQVCDRKRQQIIQDRPKALRTRNRMRDIVVGHGQDRNLGDRSIPSLYSSCTLVNRRQIGIQVTGVTSSTRYLLSCGGNLGRSSRVRPGS
mgnify:CR=1 FL=1